MKIACTKIEAEALLTEYFESIVSQLKTKISKPMEIEVKIE